MRSVLVPTADVHYLLEQDRMQELPPGLADVLQVSCQTTSDDDDNAFLAVNPFCGLRVRQNTSMVNDIFLQESVDGQSVVESVHSTTHQVHQ